MYLSIMSLCSREIGDEKGYFKEKVRLKIIACVL